MKDFLKWLYYLIEKDLDWYSSVQFDLNTFKPGCISLFSNSVIDYDSKVQEYSRLIFELISLKYDLIPLPSRKEKLTRLSNHIAVIESFQNDLSKIYDQRKSEIKNLFEDFKADELQESNWAWGIGDSNSEIIWVDMFTDFKNHFSFALFKSINTLNKYKDSTLIHEVLNPPKVFTNKTSFENIKSSYNCLEGIFLHNKTYKTYKGLFSEIHFRGPVLWSGKKKTLYYFIDSLSKLKCVSVSRKWITASECFRILNESNNSYDSFTNKEISRNWDKIPDSKSKSIIDRAISFLE